MEQRNLRIDLLRIVAAFMVVLIHVAAQYWESYPVSTYRWMSVNLYDSMGRPAVPIFLMISGMFLLSPEKQISIEKLWKKYIKKILLIFAAWSFFYAAWNHILLGAFRHTPISWNAFFMSLCKGHYHLWYCILLFGIYLVLPFLKKIAESEDVLRYFLILTGFFCIVLPWVNFSYVKAFREFLYFSFGTIFIWYFMMGYYLKRHPVSKKNRIIIYSFAIVGFFVTFFCSQWKAEMLGIPFGYYDPQMPGVVAMTLGWFVLFAQEGHQIPSQISTWIKKGATNSLGIYLLHPFLLNILNHLDVFLAQGHLIYVIPIKTVIVFFVSWVSVSALKKIPFIGEYLI